MAYKVVIGIEIHCELKTKTKMFSSAPLSFAQTPNSCVNEVDLAHPGTLPCVNKNAIKYAIMACSAFNLEIDTLVKFDRKNYFYTDLPKGYQITQQFHPIGRNGFIDINVDGNSKRINIERLHMEEDTAKQFHFNDETLIDYNRAGTPLVEIVSDPDMTSGVEAVAYISKIQEILLYLGVSDVKMEQGSMRCDINISLMKQDAEKLGTKVEIKNLNSLSNVLKAVEFEISRQSDMLDNAELIVQETRRFDETTKSTVSMRKKEGNVDYKYFPEPNIFPIRLPLDWVNEIVNNLPELPDARRVRYHDVYALEEYDANVLVSNKLLADFYELVMQDCDDGKICANWIISELIAQLSKTNQSIATMKCDSKNFANLINMITKKEISGKQAKQIFAQVVDGENCIELVKSSGMKQISDEGAILQIVIDVLNDNPQSIEDFKNGKDRAIGFLVGQVMKRSKGQANPSMANQLVSAQIKNY